MSKSLSALERCGWGIDRLGTKWLIFMSIVSVSASEFKFELLSILVSWLDKFKFGRVLCWVGRDEYKRSLDLALALIDKFEFMGVFLGSMESKREILGIDSKDSYNEHCSSFHSNVTRGALLSDSDVYGSWSQSCILMASIRLLANLIDPDSIRCTLSSQISSSEILSLSIK